MVTAGVAGRGGLEQHHAETDSPERQTSRAGICNHRAFCVPIRSVNANKDVHITGAHSQD